MTVGTVKIMGSDFISAVNALAQKTKEAIPYVCNALLKANLTSHVSKDGRLFPYVLGWCLPLVRLIKAHPPARDPRERAEQQKGE